MKLYLRILGYIRPYKGLFALAVVAMGLYGALDAFSFALLIPFLDVLFGGGGATEGASAIADGDSPVHRLLEVTVGGLIPTDSPMAGLRNVVLLIFVVYLLKNVALYVQNYTVVLIEQRVTRDLRDRIYGHLLGMDFQYFQRTRAGQIISRVTNDVDQLRSLVTKQLAKALSNAIQALIMFAMLLALSWRLTLVTLTAIPLMIGLWNHFRERLRRGVLRVWDAVGDLSSHIQETISGIGLVKAFGAEEWEARRFRRLTQQHYEAVVRNERWRQIFSPATEMINATAIMVLLLYGGWLVLVDGSLAGESFLVFAGVAMRLLSPVKWLGNFPALVQPGLAAGERAFELLDAEPRITERPGARPITEFRDAIRFEGVDFGYREGEPVLRGIDLEIAVGRTVALVGPSGAGKTTLAHLVPRFHDPGRGRITVDGVDLRDLRIDDLRSLVGVVTQETILFHDTVRANIAYGAPDVDEEEVVVAAKAAHADGFVREFPDGYDTVLGERGMRLSGGQRQRIAIARALLRNAPVLILDEATSALDTHSERLVQQAIDRLMERRTVLVIAHRLSTVRRADLIVVMREGEIVEQGRHETLLATDGLYRELYELQFAPEDEAVLRAPAEG